MVQTKVKATPYKLTDPPGVLCPECQGVIKFTLQQLLSMRPVYCSNCGLKLTMDVAQSQESVQTLQRLQKAMDQLEALPYFNPDGTTHA
jgi:transcription elongation factor Elf1